MKKESTKNDVCKHERLLKGVDDLLIGGSRSYYCPDCGDVFAVFPARACTYNVPSRTWRVEFKEE